MPSKRYMFSLIPLCDGGVRGGQRITSSLHER